MVSGLLPDVATVSRSASTLAVRKRLLDVVLGTVLAVAALPVILFLAVGVAVSLRAWPFFAHTRPGWRGRPVWVVKLRTLPPSTPRYADKDVLGLTEMPLPWLCRLLRRSHLDELPQLFSVVAGQMSLVGPRPRQPIEADELPRSFDQARTSIRPGCTGLWQLSEAAGGNLNSASRFDVFYLVHASVRLDLWIVCRTVGWVLGLARPIDLADIPRWLCGPGLTEQVEQPVTTETDAALPVPLPASAAWLEGEDSAEYSAFGEPMVADLEPAENLFPHQGIEIAVAEELAAEVSEAHAVSSAYRATHVS
jgi:lipopolysaccharide/colanic/teichoic acid biosynthesis glycosyltransferase